MGADIMWLYCGVRIEVEEHEAEAIHARKDGRVAAARRAGLRTCCARLTASAKPFLLIGTKLHEIGVEAAPCYVASAARLKSQYRLTGGPRGIWMT